MGEKFTEKPVVYIKSLNKVIKYAIDNLTALKVNKLDASTLKTVGFSEVCFAWFVIAAEIIILLGDQNDTVVSLVFQFYKARTIIRSAMSGEVIAFSDMFDYAIRISQDLAKLMGVTIPVRLLADRKALCNLI